MVISCTWCSSTKAVPRPRSTSRSPHLKQPPTYAWRHGGPRAGSRCPSRSHPRPTPSRPPSKSWFSSQGGVKPPTPAMRPSDDMWSRFWIALRSVCSPAERQCPPMAPESSRTSPRLTADFTAWLVGPPRTFAGQDAAASAQPSSEGEGLGPGASSLPPPMVGATRLPSHHRPFSASQRPREPGGSQTTASVGLPTDGYGEADNASVNIATRASSCTSADDDTSSSEPSSALAASPALLSISSAIFVSMVCAAMMRHAVTGSA